MIGHPATLISIMVAVAVVRSASPPKPAPRFVCNASESVPRTNFTARQVDKPIVTNPVVAFPPEPLATFRMKDGCFPHDLPRIKRIITLFGQIRVPPRDLLVLVNGIAMGAGRERDHRGRPLPLRQGLSRELGRASVARRPVLRSDSSSVIIGRAKSLWSFEKEPPCNLFANR
jgi:type IV secretory pathway protease TraF